MKGKFLKVILGEWVKHNDIPCNALREYEDTVDTVKNPYEHMYKIAKKHGTTIEEMKKHCKCMREDDCIAKV